MFRMQSIVLALAVFACVLVSTMAVDCNCICNEFVNEPMEVSSCLECSYELCRGKYRSCPQEGQFGQIGTRCSSSSTTENISKTDERKPSFNVDDIKDDVTFTNSAGKLAGSIVLSMGILLCFM